MDRIQMERRKTPLSQYADWANRLFSTSKTQSNLYFCTVHVVTLTLFKTLHVSVITVWPSSGVVFRTYCITTSPLVCFVQLLFRYVTVCCLCVCVPDIPVCGRHPTGRYVCGVRHPQHTQTGSNSSTITADSSNGVTNTRCCRYSCMRSW
jgi:hypothetical protein